MKRIKLNKREQEIEGALLKGEYLDVNKAEFNEITQAIVARRKDAVLNIRVNRQDLENIKQAAKRSGVRYQTLISELLHRLAHNLR